MINWSDIAYEMFQGVRNIGKPKLKYEVYESNTPTNGQTKPIEPTNVISVFTASKILSSSFSQMPIEITKNDIDYPQIKQYYELIYRMNNIQNNQAFWSTLEYFRNIYGNAFVDIRNGKNKIIHPALCIDYKITGETISFKFKKELNKEDDTYWINNKDLLHFKGMSIDGIFGLPPILAASQAMQTMDKASNTIISFYNNKAMSPLALESTINTAAGAKATLEGLNTFNAKYTSTFNAGKPMQLPPNSKLTPLQLHFADAELIETMKFTKDEIYTMYGIPAFMTGNTGAMQTDIEQQTLSYKMFTLAPIVKIYEEELSYKLLSKQERLDKVEINYNMDALVETDLKTKANAYRALLTAGIATPNEIADIMGFAKIKEEWGDLKYFQSQNIPINFYDKYSNVSQKGGFSE